MQGSLVLQEVLDFISNYFKYFNFAHPNRRMNTFYLNIIMSSTQKLTFDVFIEIPKGSRNKYEYDFELKKIRFDRMLFSSMMYPADYGFIPETLALDGDPLDVLVLGGEPTFPMCVVEVKPIGVFHMADEKGPDEKVICVPVSDPIWNNLNDLSDMNPHQIKGDRTFFSSI